MYSTKRLMTLTGKGCTYTKIRKKLLLHESHYRFYNWDTIFYRLSINCSRTGKRYRSKTYIFWLFLLWFHKTKKSIFYICVHITRKFINIVMLFKVLQICSQCYVTAYSFFRRLTTCAYRVGYCHYTSKKLSPKWESHAVLTKNTDQNSVMLVPATHLTT